MKDKAQEIEELSELFKKLPPHKIDLWLEEDRKILADFIIQEGYAKQIPVATDQQRMLGEMGEGIARQNQAHKAAPDTCQQQTSDLVSIEQADGYKQPQGWPELRENYREFDKGWNYCHEAFMKIINGGKNDNQSQGQT